MATAHHRPAQGDSDTLLFLDFDLSILGTAADRYDAYSAAVRCEFDWVTAAAYKAGRSQVLKAFLSREAHFNTPQLRALWESPARANLARELGTLEASA